MQAAQGYQKRPPRRKQHCPNYSKVVLERCGYWASGTEAGSSTQTRAVLLDVSAFSELIRPRPRQHVIALYRWLKLRSRAVDQKEVAGMTGEFFAMVLCWPENGVL